MENIKLTKNLRKFWKKAINIIKESEAEFPESILDRDHCIGPTYIDNGTGKRMQSKIFRFRSFRYINLFSPNYKIIKSDARIRLDLKKDLYNLYLLARKRVNNCPEVDYHYADINCRLKVG